MRFRSDHARGPRNFVPRLEPLDERALPSVSVVETDGVVYIVGDQRSNDIVITDDGTTNAGAVKVDYDGQTFSSTDPVTSIMVWGRAGWDNVEYDLTGDLSTQRTLSVSLGNGNDTFVANLQHNFVDGGGLAIVAHGGNGWDDLSVNAANVDIAKNANLTVALLGANGKDSLSIDYSGLLQGTATFTANGGNAKDSVTANVGLVSRTDASGNTTKSDGGLVLDLEGGNGVDDMTASLSGETDLTSLTTTIYGGRGWDTFNLSSNLTALDAPGPKH